MSVLDSGEMEQKVVVVLKPSSDPERDVVMLAPSSATNTTSDSEPSGDAERKLETLVASVPIQPTVGTGWSYPSAVYMDAQSNWTKYWAQGIVPQTLQNQTVQGVTPHLPIEPIVGGPANLSLVPTDVGQVIQAWMDFLATQQLCSNPAVVGPALTQLVQNLPPPPGSGIISYELWGPTPSTPPPNNIDSKYISKFSLTRLSVVRISTASRSAERCVAYDCPNKLTMMCCVVCSWLLMCGSVQGYGLHVLFHERCCEAGSCDMQFRGHHGYAFRLPSALHRQSLLRNHIL